MRGESNRGANLTVLRYILDCFYAKPRSSTKPSRWVLWDKQSKGFALRCVVLVRNVNLRVVSLANLLTHDSLFFRGRFWCRPYVSGRNCVPQGRSTLLCASGKEKLEPCHSHAHAHYVPSHHHNPYIMTTTAPSFLGAC